MSLPRLVTFRLIPNLRFSARRAVGFLEGDSQMDAAQEYANLDTNDKYTMDRRIEHWALPMDGPKAWFHGWPNDKKFHECFVFKLNEHRLYGFLCNPLPKSIPRFRLCVLLIYAAKHQWNSERTILKHVEQWRTNSAAKQAIAYVYPDGKVLTQ
jgi:hypothetical protein